MFIDVVDGADVGVIKCRGGFGFAPEPIQGLAIFTYGLGQELKGNEATQLRAFGFVHDAHTAATELVHIR